MGHHGHDWKGSPAVGLVISLGIIAVALTGASAGGQVAAVQAVVPQATAPDGGREAVDLTAPAARQAGAEGAQDDNKQLESMLHWCVGSICLSTP